MVEVNQIYQHYKGSYYIIRAIAVHSETLEEMVVYESLLLQKVWVRPLKDFESKVFTFRPGTGLEPRFALMKKDDILNKMMLEILEKK